MKKPATRVHLEMVDCGSGQGRSVFATAGVAQRYVEDCKNAKMLAWAARGYFWVDTKSFHKLEEV